MTDVDKYARMLELADGFDAVGEQLRDWARLGSDILRDPDVADSAELSPRTWADAEEEVRAATSGKQGLLNRGVELDADALIVRATVLTYQWIDELQSAAYKSLGSVAGRAVGYLAPEVELGGSLVSAGLIETDALDRDGVTAYLGELAQEHPELMEHIASGGTLLESLQLRSLLTSGIPRGEQGSLAAAGGLRAVSVGPFATDPRFALRDVAGELVAEPEEATAPASQPAADVPRSLEELMRTLEGVTTSVSVRPAAPGRYIAYLPGPYAPGSPERRLRLVSGDLASYAEAATQAIEQAVEPGSHLMLVGSAAGGATAASMAAGPPAGFNIDQVVTVGAPAAAAPRVPESIRVLSLEDRSDPVALLGGLINASAPHRLTVVYDGASTEEESSFVHGARAADSAPHPELRAELDRIRELGYLA
ncbi:hypothetical protein [Nocardioides sp. KR10-350]|uniref:hypothetical protein n=1 Tax=Nocardioides cheoyonin TaxID=3156615 RepID=UPI0032B39A65